METAQRIAIFSKSSGGSTIYDFTRGLPVKSTFSRASGALQYRSDGVLAWAPENLCIYSEDLVSWASNLRSTVSANADIAPDGTLSADRLIEDNTSNSHRIYPILQNDLNTTYAVSVYAKPAGRNWFSIRFFNPGFLSASASVFFNVSTGTIGTIGSGITNVTIESVGNGWYRCTAAALSTLGSSGQVSFDLANADNTVSYLGDNTSGVSFWGCHIYRLPITNTTYIKTGSSPVYKERYQYDPVTLAPLGYLHEEDDINQIRNCTGYNVVTGNTQTVGVLPPPSWAFNLPSGLTITVVGTGTSNGIDYTDIRYNGTATDIGGNNQYLEQTTQIAAANNEVWTVSAYLALVAGSFTANGANVTTCLGVTQRTSAGAGTTNANINGQFFVPTATLTRYYSTITLNANNVAYIQPRFIQQYNSGPIDFTLRIGLPQMVKSTFATMPIKTSNVAVSRSADVARLTMPEAFDSTNYPVWVVKGRTPSQPNVSSTILSVDSGSVNDSKQLYYKDNTSGVIRFRILAGGAEQCLLSDTVVTPPNTDFTIAIRATKDGCAMSVNGRAVVSDTIANIPTNLNRALVGNYNGTTDYWDSTIKSIEFRKTCNDAELRRLSINR